MSDAPLPVNSLQPRSAKPRLESDPPFQRPASGSQDEEIDRETLELTPTVNHNYLPKDMKVTGSRGSCLISPEKHED